MGAINTNRTIHNIPLEIQSSDYPGLVFLRAEINAIRMTPFALVWYAISDKERTEALRLDLDKRQFIGLSELEDSKFQEVARKLAPTIADRVARELRTWFPLHQL